MPAMNSDIDHTVDHAKGGATDVSNLGPLCRHHHRLKHEGEWKLEQFEPGVFRWTSRLGHVYTVGPGPP
jgi:HNH endonuclease